MCDGEAGGGGYKPRGEKQGRHQRLQRLLRYFLLFISLFRWMAGGQVNFDRSAGSFFSSWRSFLRLLHLAVGFRQQRGFMQAALQTEKFIILKVLCHYSIQHWFLCHPSDFSTVPEDAGIKLFHLAKYIVLIIMSIHIVIIINLYVCSFCLKINILLFTD